MKRIVTALLLTAMLVCVLTGCCLSHDWKDATCLTPQICAKCGKAEGEAKGHNWKAASAFNPKTCLSCGEEDMAAMLPFLASQYNGTYSKDTKELVIKTGPLGSEYKSYWEYVQDNVFSLDGSIDTAQNIKLICFALGISDPEAESLMKTTEKDGVKTKTGSYSNAQQTLYITSEYTVKDGLRITFCVE